MELDDFLPPAGWWHSPYLSEALHLSDDQFRQLDDLQSERGSEISRLQDDLGIARRDLAARLEEHETTAERLREAGERLATLRDPLFRKQLEMLVAQRTILTGDQWAALQRNLARENRPERDGSRGRGRDRGGRGGFGGRGGGRRPLG